MASNIELEGKPYFDEKLYEEILGRFTYAKDQRNNRKLPEMWSHYEKMYENRYWEGSGRASNLTRATSNGLFEATEVTLPVVTSRPPKPEITPKPDEIDPDGLDFANDYAKGVQRELVDQWGESGMNELIKEGFREFNIKGNLMLKSVYDEEERTFVNEIVDLYACYPDPSADSMKDCHNTFFIYAPVMTVEEVKRVYGAEVDAEGDLDDMQYYSYRSNEKGLKGVVNAIKNGMTNDKRGHVLVLEYYCPDLTEEEYEDYEYNPDGTNAMDSEGHKIKQMQSRMKYPNGRIITIARSKKNMILRDVANPYKRYPFFEGTNYKPSGDFWGTSEGRNIEDHIRIKNQIISNINDNIRFTGNPITEIVKGSGIKSVRNAPGAIIESALPNGVRHVSPPGMPSYIQNFLSYLDADMDKKTGIMDAFRGMGDRGDSGVKTQALIAQATGRLQPKVNQFVNLSKRLYEHWTYVIQNYYPDVVVQKTDDVNGEAVYEPFYPPTGADIELKVDVSMTSMLPFDNYAEFDEGMSLYALQDPDTGKPLISPEQLIDLAPSLRDKQRAKDWIAQSQEEMQMQQQMEQQQMAQQPPELTPEEQQILESTDQVAIEQVLASHPELSGAQG